MTYLIASMASVIRVGWCWRCSFSPKKKRKY